GATTFTAAAPGDATPGRAAGRVAGSGGRPGSLESAASLAWNGAGGGGGAARAMTGRCVAAGGALGAADRCPVPGAASAAPPPPPITLARTGAIAAIAVTGAAAATSR